MMMSDAQMVIPYTDPWDAFRGQTMMTMMMRWRVRIMMMTKMMIVIRMMN